MKPQKQAIVLEDLLADINEARVYREFGLQMLIGDWLITA